MQSTTGTVLPRQAEYVERVAAALDAAGLTVSERWTEPVVPVDHYLRVVDGSTTYDLVWCEPYGWSVLVHTSPSSLAHRCSGVLTDHFDAEPATVVALLRERMERVGREFWAG